MFVVIDRPKNKTYGAFATSEEALMWGERHAQRESYFSSDWFVNQVEYVQGDCAIPDSHKLSSDGDCC